MRGTTGLVRCALVLTFTSGAARAQTADAILANTRRLVVGDACRTAAKTEEVVVCGRDDTDGRHRLPIGSARAAPFDMRDGLSPIAAITSSAPCGIFAGERRCGRREAQSYGYGGARDPLTLGTRIVTRLLDPDAELDSLPGTAR